MFEIKFSIGRFLHKFDSRINIFDFFLQLWQLFLQDSISSLLFKQLWLLKSSQRWCVSSACVTLTNNIRLWIYQERETKKKKKIWIKFSCMSELIRRIIKHTYAILEKWSLICVERFQFLSFLDRSLFGLFIGRVIESDLKHRSFIKITIHVKSFHACLSNLFTLTFWFMSLNNKHFWKAKFALQFLLILNC